MCRHKTKKVGWTLRQAVTIFFLLFIVLPSVLFSYYLFRSYTTVLYNQARRDRNAVVQQKADTLYITVKSMHGLMKNLSSNQVFHNLLTKSNLEKYPVYSKKYSEDIIRILQDSLRFQNFPYRSIVLYAETEGLPKDPYFCRETQLGGLPFYQALDFEKQSFYFLYLDKQATEEYYGAKQSGGVHPATILLLVQDIYDFNNGRSCGKLVLEIEPARLLRDITGQEEYLVAFEQSGNAYGSHAALAKAEPGVARPGDNYGYAPLPDYGVSIWDMHEISQGQYAWMALRQSSILLWIVLSQAILVLLMIRWIFQRLNHSLNQMDDIIDHSFQGRLADDRRDEIGEMIHRYNLMLDRISEQAQELVSKESARQEEQYKALRHQLNPHFVYNTLHIFSAEAEQMKNYDLAEAVAYFGHLLRYNLHGRETQASLGQELENAQVLVKVYSICGKHPIFLTVQGAQGHLACRVMKYLLQPVLENAIVHGRRPGGQPLHIQIQVRQEGERLVLCLRDDGNGISEQRMAEIHAGLQAQQAPSQPGDRHMLIGLRNIDRRLELFYKGDAKFTLQSQLGVYTQVRFVIPRIMEPKRGGE